MDKFKQAKQAKQAKQVPNPKVSLKDQMITTRLFILQRIDHPEAVAVIVMDPGVTDLPLNSKETVLGFITLISALNTNFKTTTREQFQLLTKDQLNLFSIDVNSLTQPEPEVLINMCHDLGFGLESCALGTCQSAFEIGNDINGFLDAVFNNENNDLP